MFRISTKKSFTKFASFLLLCTCIQTPVWAASNALPSDVLDLTDWKLTLPINNAQEIKQPTLTSYEHEDYFKVNNGGNAVVFTAPVEGETTSGSGYPRSELREMTNNGKDKASWSTTSGTHIMEITQKITHIPDVKKHVVVGQIHDGGDDVIVFRLEDQKLFIDENGKDGPVLTRNYQLGDVFTVKFVAGNDGVMCYYNGDYVYTYPIKTSGCYFKAGMYTQSNLDKGDKPGAYGEAEIYDLNIYHDSSDPQGPSYYEGDTNTNPDDGNNPSDTVVDMDNVSVTASSHDGNKPSNTLDSSLNTRWSAKADTEPQWILYDLGSTYTLDSVDIAFYKGNIRYTNIDIEVSEDKKNWTEVYSGHTNTKSLNSIPFNFSPTEARYVRITGYGYKYFDGSESGDWVSLTDVKFNQ